jgi:hypothetical protein
VTNAREVSMSETAKKGLCTNWNKGTCRGGGLPCPKGYDHKCATCSSPKHDLTLALRTPPAQGAPVPRAEQEASQMRNSAARGGFEGPRRAERYLYHALSLR